VTRDTRRVIGPRLGVGVFAVVILASFAACSSSSSKHTSSTRTTGTKTASSATVATSAPGAPAVDTGPAPWPTPDRPAARSKAAGLVQYPAEQVDYHVHSHLDVFVNGKRTPVPAGIGIGASTLSPLHTHDESGIVHIEAPKKTKFVLGQLLTEWGVRADTQCFGGYCAPATPIAVYVDGNPYSGNLNDIELVDKREIAVVIGSAPSTIPSHYGGI